VLRSEFLRLRAAGYDALAERLAGRQERLDVVAPSGATYHVELEGFWDDKEQRDLRVVASIDDGGLRVPRAHERQEAVWIIQQQADSLSRA
jgi:hypothetical protein